MKIKMLIALALLSVSAQNSAETVAYKDNAAHGVRTVLTNEKCPDTTAYRSRAASYVMYATGPLGTVHGC